MPDPTRLLKTIRQASQAFQSTPGRKGHLVHLDSSAEVMVAGDLHGNLENFRRLLQSANLAAHPHRQLIFQELVHGPFEYPQGEGGGDKSHQLVDLLAALKCQYPNQVHLLLGNHELAQRTGQWIAKGNRDHNELFRQGVKTAYGQSAEEIYDAYMELFAVVPTALRTPNRVFISHSLPRQARFETFAPAVLEQDDPEPKEFLPGGSIHSLVWGRDSTAATATAFLQKVDADWLITGHIPCEKGFDTPNDRQLILDCMGAPACYCLLPADRPLTHQELVDSVKTL
jgi:hypothetical protein